MNSGFFWGAQVTKVIQPVSQVLHSLSWTFSNASEWDQTSALPFPSKDFFLSLYKTLLIPSPDISLTVKIISSHQPMNREQRITASFLLGYLYVVHSGSLKPHQHPGLIRKEKDLRKKETVELGWYWIALTFGCIAHLTFHSSAAILSTSEDFLIALSNIYGNTIATSPRCSKSVSPVIITLINSPMLAMLILLIKFQLNSVTRHN